MKKTVPHAYNGYSVRLSENLSLRENSPQPTKPRTILREHFACCEDERWRQVPDYPEYTVSSCGRLAKNGKLRKVTRAPRGYYVVNLAGKTVNLHTLILKVFHGPRPKRHWGCHNDGIQSNNHASNLRWDTPVGNFKDRDRHGTTQRGEKCWKAKLTEAKVLEIRRRVADGEPRADVAQSFGVDTASITRVVNRTSWKHV